MTERKYDLRLAFNLAMLSSCPMIKFVALKHSLRLPPELDWKMARLAGSDDTNVVKLRSVAGPL